MERLQLRPAHRRRRRSPRYCTALSVVGIDVEFGRLPSYRVVNRKLWLGVKHTTLHACPEAPPESFEGRSRRDRIRVLASHRHALKPNSDWAIVIDADEPQVRSIGAGLASFLEKALPDRVIPVVFSNATKSRLGWAFLGAVETGRYRDYSHDGESDTVQFWHDTSTASTRFSPTPASASVGASGSPPPEHALRIAKGPALRHALRVAEREAEGPVLREPEGTAPSPTATTIS